MSLHLSGSTPRMRWFFVRDFADKTGNFIVFQDIEAWVPPTPPGKVLLDSLAGCAKVLFEDGDSAGEGRGIAAVRAADVMSRG